MSRVSDEAPRVNAFARAYYSTRRKVRNALPRPLLIAVTYCLDIGVMTSRVTAAILVKRRPSRVRDLLAHFDRLMSERDGTVYILGTGPSVSTLSKPQFERMSRGLTIGLNHWVRHEFVPDIWIYEGTDDPGERQGLELVIAERAGAYTQVAVAVLPQAFVQRNGLPAYRWFETAFAGHFYPIRAVAPQWRSAAFGATAVRLAQGPLMRGTLLHCRSTVSLALNLAIRSRAVKKIVFVGVDLTSHIYFFEDPKDTAAIPDERREAKLHSTVAGDGTVLSIVDYIVVVKKTVCAPRRIDMFVASPKSLLARHMPVYDLSTATAAQLQ